MSLAEKIEAIRPVCFGQYARAMTTDRGCWTCKSCGDCIPPTEELTMAGDVKPARSKYHRDIKPGVFVDVYDVLKAFDVRNAALQHAIKKALAAGQRGHKTLAQDMQDIVDSAIRAKELAE